jgi:hypothetical protein
MVQAVRIRGEPIRGSLGDAGFTQPEPDPFALGLRLADPLA